MTNERPTEAQIGDAVTELLRSVRDLIEALLNRVAVLIAGESTARRALQSRIETLEARQADTDARLAALEDGPGRHAAG